MDWVHLSVKVSPPFFLPPPPPPPLPQQNFDSSDFNLNNKRPRRNGQCDCSSRAIAATLPSS
ncbi:hypothetical protein HS088_TW09G00923 [Tripterygium wilfordii]|uniref:Uncharacterized protein n=1 Tax=Tripterygium wilfordii TaxID=458696 RepID=A0A7J7D952_TRIWF|nr:hypothetical protein HS088_TW09G00923 [Tripterygium wilfordii]